MHLRRRWRIALSLRNDDVPNNENFHDRVANDNNNNNNDKIDNSNEIDNEY